MGDLLKITSQISFLSVDYILFQNSHLKLHSWWFPLKVLYERLKFVSKKQIGA